MFKEIIEFIKSGFDPNINKLVSIIKEYGINEIEARIITSAFLGWVESYLNGATCPECFKLITPDARDLFPVMKGSVKCPHCGKDVTPIMITPLKLKLAIANHASVFNTVPDEIKLNLPKTVVDRMKNIGSRFNKLMDKISPTDLYSPILSWMSSCRPDLYYTILFYDTESKTDIGNIFTAMTSTLYKIDFYHKLPKDHPLKKDMIKSCREIRDIMLTSVAKSIGATLEEASQQTFGKPPEKVTVRDVREAIIIVLNDIAKEEFDKLNEILSKVNNREEAERLINELKISTEGIKWYAGEVEEIYFKGCSILSKILGG